MAEALIDLAKGEIGDINDELDLQTEKYLTLQKKLCVGNEILYKNRILLNKLKNTTQMKGIITFIVFMALMVIITVFFMNYKLLMSYFK